MSDYPFGHDELRHYRRHRRSLRYCVLCVLLAISCACSLIVTGMVIVLIWGQ